MMKRTLIALAALLVLLVLYGLLFVPSKHAYFPWHELPGYKGIIGLVGCFVMVLFAKLLLSRLIQRPEDHDER